MPINIHHLNCSENIPPGLAESPSKETVSAREMKAIILAAGRGERLLPLTKYCPKPLASAAGKPLLEYTVESLKQASVKDLIIVTGYHAQAIQEYFGDGTKFDVRISYVYNPFFENGNGTSLKAATSLLSTGEPFLLLMSDHCIDAGIVRKALRTARSAPLLCVDRSSHHLSQIKDATKVFVDPGGFILNIGKHIARWNGIDTGVFLLDGNIIKVIKRVESHSNTVTISDCMRALIRDGESLRACDVSGLFWLDVDTFDDLIFADSILREVA